MESISLSGKLGEQHHKSHVPLEFSVPPGTTRLAGRLHTTPKRMDGALFDNLISIAIDSPRGSRGARHNNEDQSFSIDAVESTPGFVAGPVEPGRWTFWLDVFRLIGTAEFSLVIECHFDPVEEVPRHSQTEIARKGAGWYRGDLHAHTLHSDGSWDAQGLAEFARARGLDFLSLTDHNTVSGVAALEQAAPDLLVIGGLELTTHYGHALVLGTRDNEDWRAKSWPGLTMPALAATRIAEGKTFVIAHPMSPGDPACTGCRWDYEDMRPGPARLVEVWNGPWSDANEEALALYREWLTEAWLSHGQMLFATAGTDSHGPWRAPERLGFNTVFAGSLSERSILAGVRNGHNILSSGPRLSVSAESPGGFLHHPGSAAGTETVRVVAACDDVPSGATLQLVRSGGIAKESAASWIMPGDKRDWGMVELRAADGELLALSNPVFAG